jgi:hypothetical protein
MKTKWAAKNLEYQWLDLSGQRSNHRIVELHLLHPEVRVTLVQENLRINGNKNKYRLQGANC